MKAAAVISRAGAAEVRDGINERAKSIGASEADRRAAVGHGLHLLAEGKSPAVAISEGNRKLAGKAPSKLFSPDPNSPVAA